MAFVDDYSAWVTGLSAEANRPAIQDIINRAIQWEKRSGATFESEKTTIIHFTRDSKRTDAAAFTIKDKTVTPTSEARILGVVMDSKLRYKTHMANAATKGLKAAMALRRLRMLSPSTARQLFGATVAPVMDYASTIWMHACGQAEMAVLNRAQRMGAQAITGVFRTVATAVGEAEACIRTIRGRHREKATKFWINIRTLPITNPMTRLSITQFQRFRSPLQRIARSHEAIPIDRLETIEAYTLAPWSERLRVAIGKNVEAITRIARAAQGILIATSSSCRDGVVGMGGATLDTALLDSAPVQYSVTLGSDSDQNPFTAELAAIASAIQGLPETTCDKRITIFTSNQAALLAIKQPQQQSGQSSIRQIYAALQGLRERKNGVLGVWLPTKGTQLATQAKEAAQKATKKGSTPLRLPYRAKATTFRIAKIETQQEQTLPAGVGQYSKELDVALPGKHTKALYNALKRPEANVLAQLRTGMARLNGYLYRIGAVDSDQCACGEAKETVKHFLFRCTRWLVQRKRLLEQTETRRGCISFFLGGKTPSDTVEWTPKLAAVRATIQYTLDTGRLATEDEVPPSTQPTQP
jgi:hypothetical protein